MGDAGKLLIVFGGVVIALGLVLLVAGRANVPLGRLPGDLVYRGKNTTVYFPLVTSIVLSILLSLVLYLFNRFHR